MRAILLVIILAVVVVIAAIATGFVDIRQTRQAKAPDISAAGNGVTAKGGQAPAFDVETGSVKVGTENKTVKVPTIKVEPANESRTATGNAT